MKKLLAAVACLALAVPLFADVKITYLSGSVAVNQKSAWKQADTKTILATKDRIKTMANSRASVMVDGTTRMWISPNSEVEVASLGQDSFFGLLAGKIRAKVKLLSGRKFGVKTPVAVASVRGTEFVISSEGELSVLEGRVEFSDINMVQSFEVGEGQRGLFGADGQGEPPRDMTDAEKQGLSDEWQGHEDGGSDNAPEQSGKPPEKKKEDTAGKRELKEQLSELRREMFDIVRDIKTDIEVTRELTNEIKESDISAGRTLRDVHGNMVRVEQHLLRPDAQTMQILNLTKRSEYRYSDRQNWGFTPPSGARLDVMDVTVRMNESLPERLNDWPSYMSSRGEVIHPERIDVVMSNQTDELRTVGIWKEKPSTATSGKTEGEMEFSAYINGWKVNDAYKPDGDSGAKFLEGNDKGGFEDGSAWMWGVSPDMELVKDGQKKYVNIYTEVYGINNNGSILNLNSLTSGADPFTVLKQVAGEQITFVRERNGESFFQRGNNLDLVVTPDIVITVAEKMATELSDFMKSPDASRSNQ